MTEPVERRGGARANAGRKSAAVEEGSASAHILYAKARAQKEAFAAKLAELDFKIKSGEYVSREHVRQSSATAISTIAQGLRSIPDNLERKLGLPHAVIDEVTLVIDEAMAALAEELRGIYGDD
jgi:phage terminase Nu1 subunit (DNA packaging protein)